MYFDSHAHISFDKLKNRLEEVLLHAKQKSVSHIINVSADRKEIKDNVLFTKRLHSDSEVQIKCSIGVHPDHFNQPEAEGYTEEVSSIVEELCTYYEEYTDIIVAIGECGLDYYRTFDKKAQRALFEAQIVLAKKWNLPLIIHIRDAWDDFFDILAAHPDMKGILHCFTGDAALATEALRRSQLYISFSGIVTFKNASDIQEAAKIVPLDRILIETDSPFLAPEPYRGSVNEPAHVVEVARKIAELKQLPTKQVAEITTQNAKRIFNL